MTKLLLEKSTIFNSICTKKNRQGFASSYNIVSISYELMTIIEMRHFLTKWYFLAFFVQAQICQVISITWIATSPPVKTVLNSSSYCLCNSPSTLLSFLVYISSLGIYFSLDHSFSFFFLFFFFTFWEHEVKNVSLWMKCHYFHIELQFVFSSLSFLNFYFILFF